MDDLRIGVGFCEGVETLLSSTALVFLYYCVEPNKKWDMDSVCSRKERG